MIGSTLKKIGILLSLSLAMQSTTYAGFADIKHQPLSQQKRDASLSTLQLLQQCKPLLEGSQSLMGAFQSGQCSSYILGIYDLVAEHCTVVSTDRNQVVLATLKYLEELNPKPQSAVRAIDHYLMQQTQCLPVASR
ncbi:hypothetical protein SAMN02745127_01096 [Oceanospirillum multiglobuliferum]|uniref:Rap1a immunity protein domain-containing protein n=1 Tax=Oceanospirillum multiglobuliferum TaxID=64969 RepID=A0A1T4NCT4_9GAMM|nr:hypothetical protein [Oceanospirillum multiglobuliferum]OPX55920.1 hypothetical protein BTE48_06925 [Oceanospirillum multiglobuliferum]SJZ77090.1 hypothetical protein SAMN02745127_01096 [Oceanospirillum multiglobuliferum]